MKEIVLTRGLSQTLRSIGSSFIDEFLDTYKGLEITKSIIESKDINYSKALKISDLIINYNESNQNNFTNNQWIKIREHVTDKVYSAVSSGKLTIERF